MENIFAKTIKKTNCIFSLLSTIDSLRSQALKNNVLPKLISQLKSSKSCIVICDQFGMLTYMACSEQDVIDEMNKYEKKGFVKSTRK